MALKPGHKRIATSISNQFKVKVLTKKIKKYILIKISCEEVVKKNENKNDF